MTNYLSSTLKLPVKLLWLLSTLPFKRSDKINTDSVWVWGRTEEGWDEPIINSGVVLRRKGFSTEYRSFPYFLLYNKDRWQTNHQHKVSMSCQNNFSELIDSGTEGRNPILSEDTPSGGELMVLVKSTAWLTGPESNIGVQMSWELVPVKVLAPFSYTSNSLATPHALLIRIKTFHHRNKALSQKTCAVLQWQCQQPAPHREPDNLAVGVKYSGLYGSLGLHCTCTCPLVPNMMKCDSSNHITVSHISEDQCQCSSHRANLRRRFVSITRGLCTAGPQ